MASSGTTFAGTRTEFRVISIWEWRPKAAKYITDKFKSLGYDDAECTYEPEKACFNVLCQHDDVRVIQDMIGLATRELEAKDLQECGDGEHLLQADGFLEFAGGEYLQAFRKVGRLPDNTAEYGRALVPRSLETCKFVRVWSKLEEELGGMSITALLHGHIDDLRRSCPGSIAIAMNREQTTVSVGADCEAFVDLVCHKLDTLVKYQKLPAILPSHIFYAEEHKSFKVHARFLANIHPGLVGAILLDPAVLQPQMLVNRYRRIARDGTSLRVSTPNNRGSWTVMRGPPPTAVFQEKDMRYDPQALDDEWSYAPKLATDPGTEALAGLPEPGRHLIGETDRRRRVANWVTDLVEKSPPVGMMEREVFSSGASESRLAASNRPERGTETLIALGSNENRERLVLENQASSQQTMPPNRAIGRISYQPAPQATPAPNLFTSGDFDELERRRMQQTKLCPPPAAPSTSHKQPSQLIDLEDDVGTHLKNKNLAANDSTGSTMLAPPGSSYVRKGDTRAEEAADESMHPLPLHLRHDQPECNSRQTTTDQAPVVKQNRKETANNTDDPGLEFMEQLREKVGSGLVGMRIMPGEVELRADLGRIYLHDFAWADNALAYGDNDEPWDAADLLKRLDETWIVGKKLAFRQQITRFGNDADHMMRVKTPSGRRRIWSLVDRFVIYEFKCVAIGGDGKKDIFSVRVDGTKAGQFHYTFTKPDGDCCPLYVHCLARNHDVRVVIAYTETKALEAKYGSFAKALFASLRVPAIAEKPGGAEKKPYLSFELDKRFNIGINRIFVHHIARHISSDKMSYLDVNHIKVLGKRSSQSPNSEHKLVVQAGPAVENLRAGMVSNWYEASVRSIDGISAFKANRTLGFGDEAGWTVDSLKAANVFDATILPALATVKQMDGLGARNSHGMDGVLQAAPKTKEENEQVQRTIWGDDSKW